MNSQFGYLYTQSNLKNRRKINEQPALLNWVTLVAVVLRAWRPRRRPFGTSEDGGVGGIFFGGRPRFGGCGADSAVVSEDSDALEASGSGVNSETVSSGCRGVASFSPSSSLCRRPSYCSLFSPASFWSPLFHLLCLVPPTLLLVVIVSPLDIVSPLLPLLLFVSTATT